MFLAALAGCTKSSNSAPEESAVVSQKTSPAIDRALVWNDVTKSTGLSFAMRLSETVPYFFPNVMCGGVALFDCDGDGDLDILFAGGDPKARKSGAGQPALRLFRQTANWKFEDATGGSGLRANHFVMGVATGDVNNDSFVDVYVTCYGPDQLFLGRGNGKFVDVTQESGIANPAWSASACLVDFDRDGRLDLYVSNYVNYFPTKQCFDERQRLDFCGPQTFLPQTDRLFRNVTPESATRTKRRDNKLTARFEDVTATAGIAAEKGPGLGVIAEDFNNDGWPDLYVANDGASNFLWINRRDGTFRNEAALHGMANNRLGKAQAGMGLALGDVNGDGRNDLLVTHLAGEMNALYSRRRGVWEDLASRSRIGPPGFSRTGFGVAIFDFEHDGDLDVVVANGRVKRPPKFDQPVRGSSSSPRFWTAYAEGNQCFLNSGNGRFRAANPVGGWNAKKETSRGMAVGDLDNDGDLDVVIVNAGSGARVYRNDGQKSGHWLTIRATDPSLGGRDALGAAVTLVCRQRKFHGTVRAASSYLSSNDSRAHFGMGRVETVEKIIVDWPDGVREEFPGGPTDRHVTLVRQSPARRE